MHQINQTKQPSPNLHFSNYRYLYCIPSFQILTLMCFCYNFSFATVVQCTHVIPLEDIWVCYCTMMSFWHLCKFFITNTNLFCYSSVLIQFHWNTYVYATVQLCHFWYLGRFSRLIASIPEGKGVPIPPN